MAAKTILVVEPDADISSFVSLVLEEEGYQVTTVESLDEAVFALARSQFNLIITEAFEQRDRMAFDAAFLEDLRRHTEATPIILCSTRVSTEPIRAGEVGLAGLLPKPFEVDDLINKVRKLLGQAA